MKALIVGASGYNGGLVARRLADQGHTVRGLVRDPARATPGLDEIVRGDVVSGEGLVEALTGVDVAFYFVHALNASDRRTDERDRQAAHQFVLAARATELPRGVFFTTLAAPAGVEQPVYQRNRLVVEEILLRGMRGMTAVRAGMVLGAGSRGLLPYLRLAQRLPVIPLGPWRTNHIAVIDPGTTVDTLITAGTRRRLAGRSLDAPACAEPTHEQLLRAVVEALRLRRLIVPLPIATPRADAALTAAVTGDSYQFCRYLASANQYDYVVDPTRSRPFAHLTPPPLSEALRQAVSATEPRSAPLLRIRTLYGRP
ncbi:NAD(P)H-binding protein [Nocardia transvalensis]|uniref:NAD(P)H-binding protein n=1 Tax=Nocardia transvalensis TaxID=37333 RepID=UPI001894EA42|nr:NAD(P)H-binding protein [Nocardia transvalensis]MBF6330614.1 NAD(P)H-binding protein [Nocardia transvalensis]